MNSPTTQGSKINEVNPKTPHNRSTFKDLSHKFANTLRFGELSPHFVLDTVPGDVIKLRASHKLNTFTMKSPFYQNMSIKKDYFNVPYEAILPFNWEKIYANPVKGDDIEPSQLVNTILPLRWLIDFLLYDDGKGERKYFQESLLQDFASSEEDSVTVFCQSISAMIGYILSLELFFSEGSLISTLGTSLHSLVKFDFDLNDHSAYSVDSLVDEFFHDFEQMCSTEGINFTFYVDGQSYIFGSSLPAANEYPVVNSVSQLLSILRRGDIFYISNCSALTVDDIKGFVYQYQYALSSYNGGLGYTIPFIPEDVYFNYATSIAYQLICAHFYSNDKIDFLYSAELYRQNLNVLPSNPTFTFNGIATPYDYASGYYVSSNLEYLIDDGPCTTMELFCYLNLLFGYRNSLRYLDFFTGSKSQPLAVGDLNVDVNASSQVSVVDVTRGIQMQRFLNAVNRAGARFSNYIKGLFDVNVAYDYHNPAYIGHTSDVVFNSETRNTGEAQQTEANSITSVMGSNSNRFAFEFHSDRPSILMGITYFDVERFYQNATLPSSFYKDRFDMFNPFLQYIGDQPVARAIMSMCPRYTEDTRIFAPFGYQQKDMAYKQLFSRSAGGFVSNLPSYLFQIDNNSDDTYLPMNITPDFIRSYPAEIDNLFVSLTGLSLATYFHFIVLNELEIIANRPMAYNPNIL